MTTTGWFGLALALALAVYAAFLVVLLSRGRRDDARALASLVPDCLVLVRGLLGDRSVPRRSKLLLGGLLAYLVVPVDLVPDFIPVAGQLDDAILLAVVLRHLVHAAGPCAVREHWHGPDRSLEVVLRLAGAPRAA